MAYRLPQFLFRNVLIDCRVLISNRRNRILEKETVRFRRNWYAPPNIWYVPEKVAAPLGADVDRPRRHQSEILASISL